MTVWVVLWFPDYGECELMAVASSEERARALGAEAIAGHPDYHPKRHHAPEGELRMNADVIPCEVDGEGAGT